MSSLGKNLTIAYLLDFYEDLLTEKQRDAVDLYYNEDLSLAEIAELLHITRQGVRDSIKHGENLLLEYESKLHLAERYPKMEQGFREIEELCQGLCYYGQRHVYSRQIIEMAKRIAEVIQELKQSESVEKGDTSKEENPGGI